MLRSRHVLSVLSLVAMLGTHVLAATPSFICQEPGGKRLIQIDGNDISKVDGKVELRIDNDGFINDRDGKRVFLVSDDDVRPGDTLVGVKIATFDGEDIRHGAGGKVVMNYHHPDICPTSQDKRIYTIEGEALDKRQLVAGLYLLKPELFKLSDDEVAAQKKMAAEANAEEEKRASADQVAGTWTMLNSSGIGEKMGEGVITVAPKKGDAYPATFDFTKGGGPSWTGVGHYEELQGDKTFFVAYGTPKTIAMCIYTIDGGKLSGKWYPWYVDGDAKNTGSETLSGPESLDGEFKIDSAKAPTTGAAYTGTVTIKPADIVGSADSCKPYLITWTIGGAKIQGIAIKSGKYLIAATGTGADTCVGKFIINNGSMTSDWFKVGSTEKGGNAAMKDNPN